MRAPDGRCLCVFLDHVLEFSPVAVRAWDVEVGVALPEVLAWLGSGEGAGLGEEVINVAGEASIGFELPVEVKV